MASYKRKVNSQKRINKTKKQTKRPNTQKAYIIVGAIIAIAFVIYTFYQKKTTENYNNIKQDPGAYLVYTKYSDTSTQYTKEVPYVNLKADVFKEVNKDILLFCDDYMESTKSVITYEYDINGIILSLVIKVINNETTYAPEPYFRTYNINLETQEVIADDALLEFYGMTESNVERKIKRQFENYYTELVKENYYTSSECSYNCFLKYRGVSNYLDYISYYVRDGELIAFKTFIAHSIFGEEEYFDDTSFEFVLATSPAEQEETEQNVPLSGY